MADHEMQEPLPLTTVVANRVKSGLGWLDRLALPFGLPARYVIPGAAGILLIAVGVFLLPRGSSQQLTDNNPTYEVDDVLTLALNGEPPAKFEIEVSNPSTWEQTIPTGLQALSPIYTVNATAAEINLVFEISEDIPNLYQWNDDSDQWEFVPAEIDAVQGVLITPVVENPVALFQPQSGITQLGIQIDPGQTVVSEQGFDLVFAGSVEGQADGSLVQDQLTVPSRNSDTTKALPVVHIADTDALNTILVNETIIENHSAALVALAANYDGVVLDYGALDEGQREGFARLIEILAPQMDEAQRLLVVRVPTPTFVDEEWITSGYDWTLLQQDTDLVAVMPPGSPGEYHDSGLTYQFMAWAVGRVDRTKLVVMTTSLSIDEWGSQINPISYDYALAPVGMVQGLDTILNPQPDQELTFNLVGDATNLQYNAEAGAYYYDFYTGDGGHRIWLTTGAALRNRLEWLEQFQPAGIVIEDYAAAGNSAAVGTAVAEYQANQVSSLAQTFEVRWTVSDASGAVLAENQAGIGTPLAWTPLQEGEYVVRAELVGEEALDRGAAAVIIGGQTVGVAPDQEGVVDGAPNFSGPQPTPLALPPGMPPPIVPPRVFGNFELGGQVNHVINNPARMQESGMTWVKFQLAWAEDMDPSIAWGLIEQGRKHGFKVLLSVPGRDHYPTSINIPAYLEFLRGIAYYGPDAIEVWNEANLDYEWPRGQIDGARYTAEMLAPAYNAIKEVNPNIMVISGALAPNGAFFGDGGCSTQGVGCDDWLYLQQMAQAGAANYMDCVGAHFNAGATSPTVSTGHPADPGYSHYSWYFSGMVTLYGGTFGRPICFTELGYLSGEGLGAVPGRFSWAQNTTVAQQAQWLAESVQLSKQNGNVRMLIIWNVDFTYWGDDPMAGYAIIRPDGSCPACDTLDAVMP